MLDAGRRAIWLEDVPSLVTAADQCTCVGEKE